MLETEEIKYGIKIKSKIIISETVNMYLQIRNGLMPQYWMINIPKPHQSTKYILV